MGGLGVKIRLGNPSRADSATADTSSSRKAIAEAGSELLFSLNLFRLAHVHYNEKAKSSCISLHSLKIPQHSISILSLALAASSRRCGGVRLQDLANDCREAE